MLYLQKKLQKMIKNNNLDYSIFSSKKIVKESDVIKVIQNQKKENSTIKVPNQLIILFKDSKAYHAAVFINKLGIVDLSLLGAKITQQQKIIISINAIVFFMKLAYSIMKDLLTFIKLPIYLLKKLLKRKKMKEDGPKP